MTNKYYQKKKQRKTPKSSAGKISILSEEEKNKC